MKKITAHAALQLTGVAAARAYTDEAEKSTTTSAAAAAAAAVIKPSCPNCEPLCAKIRRERWMPCDSKDFRMASRLRGKAAGVACEVCSAEPVWSSKMLLLTRDMEWHSKRHTSGVSSASCMPV